MLKFEGADFLQRDEVELIGSKEVLDRLKYDECAQCEQAEESENPIRPAVAGL